MRRNQVNVTSRRAVLKGIAGGFSGLALPSVARVAVAQGAITETAVAPGFTVLSGAGGNVLAVATEAGKVLVDSGAASASAALRTAVDSLPGGGVAMLFNTHWHLDQIGSNEAFGAAGATIVAHEKTRQRLTTGYYLTNEDRYEQALPTAARPTVTFHDNDSTTVGGRRIEYGYLLEAHTDGDIYVGFPEANIIAVGDVVSPVRDPVLDWFGGGWLGGRVDSLAKLLETSNANTRFVPSYGPVLRRADIQAEHDLMAKLFDAMVVHVRLGESYEDILAAGVLNDLGREFTDPAKLLYDVHKGFWAHHNKLTHDIV
jgi:cyclase